MFSGSLDFFSDEFLSANVEVAGQTPVKAGNAALAKALALWCFKETGVLKVRSGYPAANFLCEVTEVSTAVGTNAADPDLLDPDPTFTNKQKTIS